MGWNRETGRYTIGGQYVILFAPRERTVRVICAENDEGAKSLKRTHEFPVGTYLFHDKESEDKAYKTADEVCKVIASMPAEYEGFSYGDLERDYILDEEWMNAEAADYIWEFGIEAWRAHVPAGQL